MTVAGIRRQLRLWLDTDYAYWADGFEMHYSKCHPGVVAEEYLDGYADGSLVDYKVHVFNAGDPHRSRVP